MEIRKFIHKHRKMLDWAMPVKDLLHPLYDKIVYEPIRKRKIREFQANALHVLREFDEIMTSNGFQYYLMWGSLLGAIREHGFISHDFDIDIAIWGDQDSDAIQQKLEEKGFVLEHDRVIEDKSLGRHQMYYKDKVGIDFFWFFPAVDKYPYTCLYLPLPSDIQNYEELKKQGGAIPVRVQMPFDKKERRVKFEDMMLPVPDNAEEIARVLYGPDYMIPNPNWHDNWEDEYHTKWEGKISKYTFKLEGDKNSPKV